MIRPTDIIHNLKPQKEKKTKKTKNQKNKQKKTRCLHVDGYPTIKYVSLLAV